MKENISAAFSAYEPVHYKTFQGALDAFFEQECPQIVGSRTRQTLVNFIYRGNFKSHSKNGKDAIRKELQRVVCTCYL